MNIKTPTGRRRRSCWRSNPGARASRSWATVRNILDFPNAFSPAADMITVERTHRSTQPIMAAGNGVIELAAERFTKNLRTERQSAERPQLVSVRDEADQAGYIIERVLENREVGTLLKQQAVLFRTSHHSGPLEVELTRRNIPFVKFGGLSGTVRFMREAPPSQPHAAPAPLSPFSGMPLQRTGPLMRSQSYAQTANGTPGKKRRRQRHQSRSGSLDAPISARRGALSRPFRPRAGVRRKLDYVP